ncbi:MAG TPA: hypothetical protein VNZ58_04830 [Thermomicrobiales bacterium]|nr:hypothetical protein [Thermomicrobiales bacterium]
METFSPQHVGDDETAEDQPEDRHGCGAMPAAVETSPRVVAGFENTVRGRRPGLTSRLRDGSGTPCDLQTTVFDEL